MVAVVALPAGCSGGEANGDRGGEAPDDRGGVEQLPDELRALYERYVEEKREIYLEPDWEVPTDVGLVRFVEPDEYGRVIAQCVRDQGFDATETFDGGVSYGAVPDDQTRAQREAIYRCEVQYPLHPRYLQPFTEDQIRTVYRYYVNELTPCLEAEGFAVGDPPSEETFIATYGTADMWSPYDSILRGVSPEEWQQINERCPQEPPLEDLYGD